MGWTIVLVGWLVLSCAVSLVVGRSLRAIGLHDVPPRPDVPLPPAFAAR
jgi:hypothetical protein